MSPHYSLKSISITISCLIAFILLLCHGSISSAEGEPSSDVVVIRRCICDYEQTSTVGASIYSTLQDCSVKPGDRVIKGQVLGTLRNDDAKALLKLSEVEASSDVEVRLSQTRSERAAAKAQRTAALVRRNASSSEEYHEHRLEAAAAALEVEMSRHRHDLSMIRLELARAELRNRELISPHDGIVAAVFKRVGEPVAPRDPIFQVVNPDQLIISGRLDITRAWQFRAGRSLRAVPEIAGADLPVEHEIFTGILTFIDSQVDPTTRTCKFTARVKNHGNLLKAGLELRVELDPETPSTARQRQITTF